MLEGRNCFDSGGYLRAHHIQDCHNLRMMRNTQSRPTRPSDIWRRMAHIDYTQRWYRCAQNLDLNHIGSFTCLRFSR